MSLRLKDFLKRWVVCTVAVLVATQVVPGIRYDQDDWLSLLLATLVLGLLNTFVRPILLFLSLPLLIFTLGLFTIVINAFLLYLVGQLFQSFEVVSFGSALLGALVISIISILLNSLTGSGQTRVRIHRNRRRPRSGTDSSNRNNGEGPIIDV